jgi:hypothetical protein
LPRQTDARRRITDYLSTNGPVEDRSGKATSILKDAIGYEGTHTGFIQLVAAMAKSGDVHRDVRGKRTYRVWVPTTVSPPGNGAGPDANEPGPAAAVRHDNGTGPNAPGSDDGPSEVDYDELAATLLARVTRLVAQDEHTTADTSWARRRLERLETQNAKLERDLARLRGEAELVRQERDALRDQLQAAERNLNLLTDRLGSTAPPRNNAANHLDADERALLRRLGGDRPARRDHSERAG